MRNNIIILIISMLTACSFGDSTQEYSIKDKNVSVVVQSIDDLTNAQLDEVIRSCKGDVDILSKKLDFSRYEKRSPGSVIVSSQQSHPTYVINLYSKKKAWSIVVDKNTRNVKNSILKLRDGYDPVNQSTKVTLKDLIDYDLSTMVTDIHVDFKKVVELNKVSPKPSFRDDLVDVYASFVVRESKLEKIIAGLQLTKVEKLDDEIVPDAGFGINEWWSPRDSEVSEIYRREDSERVLWLGVLKNRKCYLYKRGIGGIL